MKQAYIIDGVRTGIANFAGTLSTERPDDLFAAVLNQLMDRNTHLDPSAIEDVIAGCANQAGEDNRNVARMALLLAGLPVSVPGETVNRLCASGMSAVISAARGIQTNNGDVFLAGGVESMTRAPWVISKSATPFGRDAQMHDSSFGWRFVNPKMQQTFGTDGMGLTAENLIELFPDISREAQDRFALHSQKKANDAWLSGRMNLEIMPYTISPKKGDPIVFAHDEFRKPKTTIEALATLKPAFKTNGSVTAGNSSGLNDGAAALLLASDEGIKNFNLTPRARIVASAASGVEPRIMGIGPVEATRKALLRAQLSLDQIDIIEINEAFAAQVLACTRSLGIDDNDPRINPNGGAIALGHPLGMSGARIILSAAIDLSLSNKKYALCTMCVGVGQGFAVILEKA